MNYFSESEIKGYKPEPLTSETYSLGALKRTKHRMHQAGVWAPNQVLGRRNPIGCVALEITQRCNLDCTICYLSEHSESVKDIPIEQIFKRIEMIKHHFGPGTDVQVTGGDPTLRKRSELLEIVKRIAEAGLGPTLMTNGKLATRELLSQLKAAGLRDVAFHVDLTQERKGFSTEVELNKVRQEYVERARGLGLAVIFNTTVFRQNFHEIPELVRFFKKNADVIGMASFQLQADTGRGEFRKRDEVINLDNVCRKIEEGAGTSISFENVRIGHPQCHRYGLTLQANNRTFNFFDNSAFFEKFLEASTRGLVLDKTNPIKTAYGAIAWLLKNPSIWGPGFLFLIKKAWEMKKDFILGGGRVHKLTFFMQNFMDASQLEKDRIHACSFMVMTNEGPVSMCMHNAKRDHYILQPLPTKEGSNKVWDPLLGKEVEKRQMESHLN